MSKEFSKTKQKHKFEPDQCIHMHEMTLGHSSIMRIFLTFHFLA